MKTEKETTNDLRYNVIKTKGGLEYHVKIRLNDECKNGHNDFSITGTIYEANKPKIDRYCHGGGAIGDTLAELFPAEFALFNSLHLCDVNGAPMYATGNGFYHLKQGFNNTPTNSPTFKGEYCEYYRITTDQFDTLVTAEDEKIFAYYLCQLGIVKQWKEQAKEAIKKLEELTGLKFKDDSTRLQKICLTNKEKAEILTRINSGYYTPEAIEARRMKAIEDAKLNALKEIEDDFNKAVEKERNEYLVKKAVLLAGLNTDNFIYYSHNNEAVFNWNTSSYNKAITHAEFDRFIKWIKQNNPELPKGIVFKIKD